MPEFQTGQHIRIPGTGKLLTVDSARRTERGWRLFLEDATGQFIHHDLTAEEAEAVEFVAEDGGAVPTQLLAALWCEWMTAATVDTHAAALASTPLRPYAHQTTAVYGAMLPQPRLRFLLADEP